MKLTRNHPGPLSQVIHAPVNGAVAFFAIMVTCVFGVVAIRVAPSSRKSEPFVLKGSAPAGANARQVPLPPRPGVALVGTDNLGMPYPLGEYYVGVYVESVDPALQAQLKLEGGLVVRYVVPNSPAEAAGVKQNDLMLRAGDAKLCVICDLGAVINKAGAVEMPFEFLREGAPLQLSMTPAKRPAKMWSPPGAETASIGDPGESQTAGQWIYSNPATAGVAAKTTITGTTGRGGSETVSGDATRSTSIAETLRIEALEKELAKAQEELKKLKAELAEKDARQTERQ